MSTPINTGKLALDALPPDSRPLPGIIEHSGEPPRSLMNGILDYSKTEAGRRDIDAVSQF